MCATEKENCHQISGPQSFKASDREGMLAMDLYSYQDRVYLTIIELKTVQNFDHSC